jgi:hypothetical protein
MTRREKFLLVVWLVGSRLRRAIFGRRWRNAQKEK